MKKILNCFLLGLLFLLSSCSNNSDSAPATPVIVTPFLAYVTSQGMNTILKCEILEDGSFVACKDSGNTGVSFSNPYSITLNSDKTFTYITNKSQKIKKIIIKRRKLNE